jgi:hypothetical protein
MPVNACVVVLECTRCGHVLRPNPADCCVFCSHGSQPCPPCQAGTDCDDAVLG